MDGSLLKLPLSNSLFSSTKNVGVLEGESTNTDNFLLTEYIGWRKYAVSPSSINLIRI